MFCLDAVPAALSINHSPCRSVLCRKTFNYRLAIVNGFCTFACRVHLISKSDAI